jgi:hypothetical protein
MAVAGKELLYFRFDDRNRAIIVDVDVKFCMVRGMCMKVVFARACTNIEEVRLGNYIFTADVYKLYGWTNVNCCGSNYENKLAKRGPTS